MYNKLAMDKLIHFIKKNDGIGDKQKLATLVQNKFSLDKDRSVYYCDDFAIRFGWNGKDNQGGTSNTVLSLEKIKKYNDRPLVFCLVTHKKIFLVLINATFIKKVSHSSQALTIDNIKGSINYSDIMLKFQSLENTTKNFEKLFNIHEKVNFEDNLERIVENTNTIKGRISRFNVLASEREMITGTVQRTKDFINSKYYQELECDLEERVSDVKNEIIIVAKYFSNVNLRGRIIEYLITEENSLNKDNMIDAINNGDTIPKFKTDDKLGDYSKEYPGFIVETDIKTKILFSDSSPKGYNIEKLLHFLDEGNSVYMIFLVGIDENNSIITRLCSFLDNRLIDSSRIQHHWSGRGTRGVVQFEGMAISKILEDSEKNIINDDEAINFLNSLIDLGGEIPDLDEL